MLSSPCTCKQAFYLLRAESGFLEETVWICPLGLSLGRGVDSRSPDLFSRCAALHDLSVVERELHICMFEGELRWEGSAVGAAGAMAGRSSLATGSGTEYQPRGASKPTEIVSLTTLRLGKKTWDDGKCRYSPKQSKNQSGRDYVEWRLCVKALWPFIPWGTGIKAPQILWTSALQARPNSFHWCRWPLTCKASKRYTHTDRNLIFTHYILNTS